MAEAKQEMLPDSTQGETPEQSKKSAKGSKRKQKDGSKESKKKKKTTKKKKPGVKEGGSTKSGTGSAEDSDLDLSVEKKPLGCYLGDREELINQAFKAVKQEQLAAMIPDILKYVPIDELKRLCLSQLEGMSRKRIKHAIEGTEMLSSSDSDESVPEAGMEVTKGDNAALEVQAPGAEVVAKTMAVQADATSAAASGPVAEKSDSGVNNGDAVLKKSGAFTKKGDVFVIKGDVVMKKGSAPVKREDGAVKKGDTVAMETSVDSTVEHVQTAQGAAEDREDIDGVPVEIDVNIEDITFQEERDAEKQKSQGSKGDATKKDGWKKGKANEAGKENIPLKKRYSEGSPGRSSDKVSSSRQRSRSRSSKRRRSRSYSRSRSRSRSRRRRSWTRSRSRSWSRSRSRRRSWTRSRSRSWTRSRSRSWSRSRSRSRSRPESRTPKEPSPPKPPTPPFIAEAIQMRYPTPPTPTGSLSSGEIREILEWESDEEEGERAEESNKTEGGQSHEEGGVEEGMDGDDLIPGRENKHINTAECQKEDRTAGRKNKEEEGHKDEGRGKESNVVGKIGGAAMCSSNVQQVAAGASQSQSNARGKQVSTSEITAGGERALLKRSSVTHIDQLEKDISQTPTIEDSEEDDDVDVDSGGDGDDEDDEEDDDDDDDIDIDALDLGVDLNKAKNQPSQLALARASMKSPGASGSGEQGQESGEAKLEVLELELRARAIRSLMHKCLTEDEKT